MNINEIVASRIYSWVYEGEAKLLKGGRAGVPPNPLAGSVTKRAVYAGQAASGEMYANAQKRLDPAWEPKGDGPFEATENPCVVKSTATGDYQVRILHPRTVKCEFFVNGQLATSDELSIIAAYKPARKPSAGVKVMFPYIHHLTNVEGELAEQDTEE